MLQPMISQKQRENELRLLKEYEASGKIVRLDYVPPKEQDDHELSQEDEAQLAKEGKLYVFGNKESLGDGNYKVFTSKE